MLSLKKLRNEIHTIWSPHIKLQCHVTDLTTNIANDKFHALSTMFYFSNSLPYAHLNISEVSVAVYFHFAQNVLAAVCSILKPST
jgi:hypothetical protein